jgi:hypothetical protein
VGRVNRVAVRLASAIGVLIALAVFDFGPRAGAAYQSMTVKPAAAGLDASAADPGDANPPPTAGRDRGPLPVPGLHHTGDGGGMVPSGSGSSSGSSPVAGYPSRTELPASGLVVYYREPATPLAPSAFNEAVHGPPRRA